MNKPAIKKYFRVVQLVVSGAIIGLYVAKGFGFFGVEITQAEESLGAVVGAGTVALLKIIHLA